jgi:hypothetical protein
MRKCQRPTAEYLSRLCEYRSQARARDAKSESRAPDPALLTQGLGAWLHSVADAEVEKIGESKNRIKLSLYLPKSIDPTLRCCDPEFL